MFELYIETRDSIDSEGNQKEVIKQKYKYEYEKAAVTDSIAYAKEQILQEVKLDKARTQQYGLIGGIILIIIISIVLTRSYLSQKSSNKELNEQNELISNQKEEIETNLDQLENTNTKLEEKGKELEKFNSAMLDREMRIIDLKKETNKLSKEAKLEIPYPEIGED
jgi:uncharacterized membrane-anchored protein YhcB (DUF1043 family)